MDWETLFAGRFFITDLGENHTADIQGKKQELGRYAVWCPNREGKGHTVIEVSANLTEMMKKYHITEDCVCII